MGGSCLGKQMPRISPEKYWEVVFKLCPYISDYFNHVAFPAFFSDKDSFGDIDILVSELKDSNWKPKLFKELGVTLHKSNGNIHSFEYENTQVDIITCEEKQFSFHQEYLSYGDMGNLIGRIARHVGYKFGSQGLVFPYNGKDIMVTTDWDRAIEFLGFTSRFEGGTKEQMFDWIISSIYFHPAIYHWENRNYSGKHRDSKRQTYLDFLEYTSEMTASPLGKAEEFWWFQHGMKTFREFKANVIEALTAEFNADLVREKFNGKIVSELTGLTDKSLGDFIHFFKHTYVATDFNTLVLGSSAELIRGLIATGFAFWLDSNREIK